MKGIEHGELAIAGADLFQEGSGGGDFIAVGFYKHGAQHASAGQAQSADKLGFLFVFDFGGAATLGFAVDGDEMVLIGFGGPSSLSDSAHLLANQLLAFKISVFSDRKITRQ